MVISGVHPSIPLILWAGIVSPPSNLFIATAALSAAWCDLVVLPLINTHSFIAMALTVALPYTTSLNSFGCSLLMPLMYSVNQ